MRIVGNDPTLSRQITATASGAISAAGKSLVVNTDGTVSVVSTTGLAVAASTGTPAEYENATIGYQDMVFDPDSNKVIITYPDAGNSNYGTAIVGTVSGTSISYGSAAVFETSHTGGLNISVCYDTSNDKVVVVYRDQGNSGYLTAAVGTVSGTSISFGTPSVIRSTDSYYVSCAFDSNVNKVAAMYQDVSNSSIGYVISFPVSGTGIGTVGNYAVFSDNNSVNPLHYPSSIVFDSNANKFVVFYPDTANSSRLTAKVCTIDGTNWTFGSAAIVDTTSANYSAAVFDSNSNKVVVAFRDSNNSNYGTARVGTVSGTSISFGDATVFESASISPHRPCFDSNENKIIIPYKANNTGKFNVGTVSGTGISFGTSATFNSNTLNYIVSAFDTNTNKAVFAYMDGGDSNHGYAAVFSPASLTENLTTENFIGTSAHSAADGAKVLVNTQGAIDENQSGLTAGQTFFVNKNGALVETTNITTSAGTPQVFESAAFGSNEGSISFDTTNNRIIIAYPDDGNSSYGTAIVGTVDASNNSITFGTPEVFVSVGTSQMTSAFDTNAGKVAIMYRQGSTSRAIVGTVDSSDNSMSFGSSMEWNSTYSNYQYATFDSTNNKILMVFSDYTSGTNGMAIVGTISGTDITFSSKATFYSGVLFNQHIKFDPSQNKSLITYRKNSDSKLYARVGTSTSGSFSYGTEVQVKSTNGGGHCTVYHADEQKMVVFFQNVSGSYYHLDAKVATISGTDVSFGSEVSIDTGNNGDSRAIYDPDGQQIAVVFRDDSATSLELKLCTLSGSTLALSGYTDSGEGTVLDTDDAYYFDVVYDTNADRLVASYLDNGNSSYGTSVVARLANDTSGSLSADAVTAGTALSATKLLVKG